MIELYNDYDNLKDRYLNTITNPNTRKLKSYILSTAGMTERVLNKDLCQMNFDQLERVLSSYRSGTDEYIYSVAIELKEYLRFCDENNYLENGINYLSKTNKKMLKKYVIKEIKNSKYFTFEDMERYQSQLINPRDIAVMRIPTMGVKGDDLCEMLDLSINHIYIDYEQDKYLIKIDKREIEITEDDYNILIDAHETDEYITGNGTENEMRRNSYRKITPSDYILRPAGTSKGYLERNALRNIMTHIKIYIENKHISFSNFWKNGMYWRLEKIEAERALTVEDYEKILYLYQYNVVYYILKNQYEEYKMITRA